jgi:hypothetical protein
VVCLAAGGPNEGGMTREKIIAKIRELLKTDTDLSFLLSLSHEQLETLIASIRDRIDYYENHQRWR